MDKKEYVNEVLDEIKEFQNDFNWDLNDPEIKNIMESDLIDSTITGGADGSYYCNRWAAKETVLNRIDEVANAFVESGNDQLANMIYNQDWEAIDVIARCYYLNEAIDKFLDEK